MTPPQMNLNSYTEFDARGYLNQYYATMYPENRAHLNFLVEQF